MRALAERDPLSVYYECIDVSEAAKMLGRSHRQIKRRTAEVERQTSEAVPKLTELVGDTMRIVTRPPIIQPLPPEYADSVKRVIAAYAESLRVDRRLLFERFELVVARPTPALAQAVAAEWRNVGESSIRARCR